MNSKLLTWVVIAVVVIGGGWYFYSQQKGDSMTGDKMQGDDSAMMEGDHMAADPMMTGTWKSTEDAKFTRTFKADGTVTDAYEGEASATETASYTVVDPTKETGLTVPAANLSGLTVIRIDFASGPMYFSINKLTETDLQMTNLSGRGNILMFTKVQ